MRNAVSGAGNISLGSCSLYCNVSGSANIAIGNKALFTHNCNGSSKQDNNIAIGSNTLSNQISSKRPNIAIGSESLYNNVCGSSNLSVGWKSSRGNQYGNYNISLGEYSLYYNVSGSDNIAIGRGSQYNSNQGSFNISLGFRSLCSVYNGNRNIAIGCYSLYNNTTGYNNISIGQCGSNNSNYNNSVALGNFVGIQQSNYFHIGSSSSPLGTVVAYGPTPAKYWPVYINGVLECILLG
jgi:hypothetical protein